MSGVIVINGYAFSAEDITDLLYRAFWKQTSGVNLDTADGCREAAAVTVRWMAAVGPEYHPSGTLPLQAD